MSEIVPQTPNKQQYRPRGRPFAKGQSGNPAGRRRGSRNKATLMAALYLDGEAVGLARKAVEMAYAGDTLAMRLCLERTIAPRRARPGRRARQAAPSAVLLPARHAAAGSRGGGPRAHLYRAPSSRGRGGTRRDPRHAGIGERR